MVGGVRAAAGLLAAAALAGCGGGAAGAGRPVAAVATLRPTPLVGTTWLLTRVTQPAGATAARPTVDATLLIKDDGHYLLRSCNNIFGTVTTTGAAADFTGGSDTWRHCPGVAGRIDDAVAAALPGHVHWAVDGSRLTISNPAGTALEFRVRDGAPPLDAAPVTTLIDGAVRCRLIAGHTADGDRLYALTQVRTDGPWRLVPTGPAAPGEGPLLIPQVTDSRPARDCAAGFAPAGTATVTYRAPGGTTTDLPLHRVVGFPDPVYVGGVLSGVPTGRLVAADAAGYQLSDWATTP
jgi:heat shock protein HslJ